MTAAHVRLSSAYIKGMLQRDFTIKPFHHLHQFVLLIQYRGKMKDSLAINNNNNIKTTNSSSSGNNNKLCVTVVGSSAVGKTALTVQYLTNRFIGDYYSGTDMTYPHSFSYMGGSLKTNVDILDISRPSSDVSIREEDEMISSLVDNCAEKSIAFLVVYSLTNSKSFERARQILSKLPFNSPKYLVANQLDLQHRRQVSRLEGQTVADQFGCPFDEFSAVESLYEGQQCGVKIVFQKLIRQLISNSHVLPYPRMIRFSAFSKMIGAIVSKTRHSNNKLQQQQQQNNKRKSSMSSCSNSSGNNSSGSVDSIATLTPEMSLLHIDNTHLMHGVKSKAIPIIRREMLIRRVKSPPFKSIIIAKIIFRNDVYSLL